MRNDTKRLEGRAGPAIANADYVGGCADQIRTFFPIRSTAVSFGGTDNRASLRQFLMVDLYYVAHASLAAPEVEKMNSKRRNSDSQ
jgi:pyruvate dehydrogenase complex dehydrogenase (E1) component